ncbi:MAG: methyltransferase domain-containing protein [Burkholderiaceae bacterium]|nr:MAG: methyltransferase domain-containing protein [Burkholderiaceae bacterium]MCC7286423.1 methyltransferase domain-containing protein [Burkholderiaceae bacterium]
MALPRTTAAVPERCAQTRRARCIASPDREPLPMTDPRLSAVERFYDFHPINAKQILDAVAARGIAPEAITEAVLQQHDQDHYGGTAATDRLIAEAAVRADDVVLDICSGMGGPARYLAWKTDCDVTGLDLTASRVQGAGELTRLAGLADRVRFVHGNALEMPFDDASFTLAIAQEAFAHIPDKPRLLAECARVLQPGGRLVFSDILHRGDLSAHDAQRLLDGMTFSEIETLDGYAQHLGACGMTIVQRLDLTAEWTRILVERHAMYRSLEPDTVARLGREHFERYDRAYEHFVGLYRSGVLAGALIHAVRGR